MARAMVNVCKELEVNPADYLKCYKKILFGEKTVKEEVRQQYIENGFIGEFFYFRHDCITSFFAIDCNEHQGIHIPEDYFIVEAVDPKTGEVVDDGEEGALSITNLLFRTTPQLRFTHSRQKVKILRYQCPCGRTTARLIYTK